MKRFAALFTLFVGILAAQIRQVTLQFDPASNGATKTAFKWSPICDTRTTPPRSNLDQQSRWIIGGSAITVIIVGNRVCWQSWYMTDTLIPVGSPSVVQVLGFAQSPGTPHLVTK